MDPDSGTSVPGLDRPHFQTCFCLGAGATEVRLDLDLYADDQATVFLNCEPIAGPGGGFNTPSPFSVHYSELFGQGLLQAGENCLLVEVNDSGGVVTGLDLTGSLRVENGSCAAFQAVVLPGVLPFLSPRDHSFALSLAEF